jgi:hypothetical protein
MNIHFQAVCDVVALPFANQMACAAVRAFIWMNWKWKSSVFLCFGNESF